MIILPFFSVFLLYSAANAEVHRMKLHKTQQVVGSFNPGMESLYLAGKYYGMRQQTSLTGTGGASRNIRMSRFIVNEEVEQIFWYQNIEKGGHSVPLSSKLIFVTSFLNTRLIRHRFHECSVFLNDQFGFTATRST